MMHLTHTMQDANQLPCDNENVQLGLVYKYRAYFENIGSNWSKLGNLIG